MFAILKLIMPMITIITNLQLTRPIVADTTLDEKGTGCLVSFVVVSVGKVGDCLNTRTNSHASPYSLNGFVQGQPSISVVSDGPQFPSQITWAAVYPFNRGLNSSSGLIKMEVLAVPMLVS